MCFSAEADLVAGVVITAIGVDAIRQNPYPQERLLATLPIVLGIHQLVETAVWWGLDGTVGASVGRSAIWLYLIIAFGIVPIWVPLAVATLETPTRRIRLAIFVTLGTAVAAGLMHALVRGPVGARIDGYHLTYRVDVPFGGFVVVPYVIATCGSLLLSGDRSVRRFGGVNLFAVLVLATIDRNGLVSLWCLWAAIASVAIDLRVRSAMSPPDGTPVTFA